MRRAASWTRRRTSRARDDDARRRRGSVAAIRAGARGYQSKGAAEDETLRAIRPSRTQAIFSPAIAERLQLFLGTPPGRDPGVAFPQLTDRELEDLAVARAAADERRDCGGALPQPENGSKRRFGDLREAQVADRAEAGCRARRRAAVVNSLDQVGSVCRGRRPSPPAHRRSAPFATITRRASAHRPRAG